jgi:VWFA-related protein
MSVDLWRWQPAAVPGEVTVEVVYVDRVKFPEITLYLTVRDANGQMVPGLAQKDFAVIEDGVDRDVTDFVGSGDQPVTAMMLVDRSGSMGDGAKMANAIDASLAFLDQLCDGRDTLGVIAFDEKFVVLGDLRIIDAQVRANLGEQISALTPGGGTAYYDAIYEAADGLKAVPGRKVVLALTDGRDTSSIRSSLGEVVSYVQDSNVVVYTIGLGTDVQAATLKRIARDTGGRYYEEPSGNDLAQIYTDIAQDLQSEYSLTYVSSTPHLDGTTRRVEVQVNGPTGMIVAEGSYAVGGTFAPSLNVWSCAGVIPLLFFLLGLLAGPSLYDRVRGRGKLLEMDEVPPAERPPTAEPFKKTPAAQVVCTTCATVLRPGARFCNRCGRSVIVAPSSTCTHCGALVRPAARFCRVCGNPQVAAAPKTSLCSRCGAVLKPGARFCANCRQEV